MSEPSRINELDWEDVRIFAALARHRTLVRTGHALRLRSTEVSRRISNLEKTLGRTLFSRHAGRFKLSPEGVCALGEAAQMEMAACALVDGRDYVPPARARARRTAR